jgi:MFS family permease
MGADFLPRFERIVLPISEWFASVLGRKRFFLTCLTIFILSSLLCGTPHLIGAPGIIENLWQRTDSQ